MDQTNSEHIIKSPVRSRQSSDEHACVCLYIYIYIYIYIYTSFIQCKQIIKTFVLSEKLTNVESMNHVERVEKTGGMQPISMTSRTDNLFSFGHFVPIISTFL